jgi:receptor protein-tyrosine kinase
MSEPSEHLPSEHLIERAAAKLRAANAAKLPDGNLPAAPKAGLPSGNAAEPPRAFQLIPDRLDAPPPPSSPAAAQRSGPATPAIPDFQRETDLPEHVPGPIPSPAPPLTRPVVQPMQPPLTIAPGQSNLPHPPPLATTQPPLTQPAPPQPAALQPSISQPTLPQPGQRPGLFAAGPAMLEGQGAQGASALPPPMALPRAGTAFATRGPALTSLGFDMPPGMAPGPAAGSALALQPPPIVQLDALERAGMVVARTTRTRISEEYRIAIGRILRVLHETTDIQGARNVLMVTSARPGEGKSFTALNLAGSIAQNGTDAVLLVDVDPKVKPLSDQLGLGEVQGFLDLVSDPSLRPEDLLRVTAIPNMAILPVGTRLGGAAQTIGGTASMRPIIPTITRLARRFPKHLIMLDAPPCLSTSDPHTLAPHVGQVVLVVEAERTQRSEVEAAVDLVRVCPSITLLLNKVRMTTSHTFGAYDYFGSYT